MKKKAKGIVGLCLVAALAVGGVGTYAHAADGFSDYDAYGGCNAYKNSGTAYTVAIPPYSIYGSVSATFWCEVDGVEDFRNGNGAGGEHGASVAISYPGNAEVVTEAHTRATHIITWDAEFSYTEYTDDDWRK